MLKEIGIIESVNDDKKEVNIMYGAYLGMHNKPIEESEDITMLSPKVKLDNGTEVWVDDYSFFSSKIAMEETIADFKNKGYSINVK